MNRLLRYSLPVGAAILLTLSSGLPAFASSSTLIPDSAAIGLSNFNDLGEAAPSALMNMTVLLKLNNEANLHQQIASHQKITPSAFHQNYSPDGNSYNAVVNQLQKAGFTIIGTSDNNMAIDVEGPVSAVESTFGTKIHQFQQSDGTTFLANLSDLNVSGALAAHLSGVVGVDEFANPRPMLQQTTESGSLQSNSTPNGLTFFNGNHSASIQTAYDFGPAYQSGLDGTGQTIAIVDAYGSPTIQQDLAQFNQQVEQGAYGADKPLNLTVMAPPGLNVVAEKNKNKALPAYDWGGEVSMDVELSHAAAPGANILLVATPNNGSDLYMGVNQIVDKHLANQVSLSFGGPEVYTPASERTAIDQIFEQAAAEGINVFVSSGDWGDFGPTTGYFPEPRVSFPASDPNVVAVGGSALFVNNTDSSYGLEIPWGDTFTKIVYPDGSVHPGYFVMGAGGGTSQVFAKPAWQTGVSGLSSTNMRQVPDVGFDSDPYTGFALVHGGQLQSGWGGTSDAAPQWAAICAIANQGYAAKNNGAVLPFINPILYSNSYNQGGFHDVLPGTVQLVLKGASTKRLYYMTMGDDTSLDATPGWDNTTGIGTPDVAKIVNELVNSQN